MHELKLLQDQFKKAAERFPGLTHVSVTWPDDKPRQVPECYKHNPQNLVELWNYTIRQEKLVVARRHWLLRPKGENWNKDTAFRELRELSEEAVPFLRCREVEIGKMFYPDFYMPGEDDYRDIDPVVQWCLELYWSVLDPQFASFVNGPSPTAQRGPVSWIENVFHKSAKLVRKWRAKIEADGVEGKQKLPVIEPKAEHWKQIAIEVVDDDMIKYKVNDKKWERANYIELGFLDKRKNMPKSLWPIFLGLASKNLPSNIKRPKMKPKDIDRIRDTLRAFFGIKSLPIKYDRKAKEYCCIFKFSDPRDWKGTLQNENLVD
ncbi:MAG: hypothetical protein GY845_23700 [Planctomycetes bacterium]|nr:hypothetical protein [Planctomycetota bacterium]